MKQIFLASDHAGLTLRRQLVDWVKSIGDWSAIDLGTQDTASSDYPDHADRLASELAARPGTFGALVCGTGIGISIAANRHVHIRAALVHDVSTARLAREHNNANVIALGARMIGPDVAIDCLQTFLDTSFAGGRHARRVDKLTPPGTAQMSL